MFDHLYASLILLPYIRRQRLDNIIIAAPDVGASKRAAKFSDKLGVPLVLCYKVRKKANIVDSIQIIGDVAGKNVILVDDMVDTAGTITMAADEMKRAGALSVRAVASHCIMSGPASDRVTQSALEEIVFTDSIPYHGNCKKVKQLSCAKLFAKAIEGIEQNRSLSSMVDFDLESNGRHL